MTEHLEVETIVVGGGVIGAATAWALARDGRSVALWEAHEEGHRLGASHGSTRNFNPSYSRPEYLELVRRALPLWRELEEASGRVLLEQTGIVNRGPRADGGELAALAPRYGFAVEDVPADEAARRWPGLRFATTSTFMPDGGRLFADRAVAALLEDARRHGADVRHGLRARMITPVDRGVRVQADGVSVSARTAVVAAGAWSASLLDGLVDLPPLRVTEESPAHFALRGGSDGAAWPSFNHSPEPSAFRWPGGIYGLVSPGEGVKVGWHAVGPEVTPATRTFQPPPEIIHALRAYVREWIPGADPDVLEPISCTYTSTETGDFILDTRGPIVVAAGFSGHGFKFAPAIGEHVAGLARGATAPLPVFSARR